LYSYGMIQIPAKFALKHMTTREKAQDTAHSGFGNDRALVGYDRSSLRPPRDTC
jgi:hypothetical protein